MEITQRQKEILNRLVEEYINSAEPVSSKLLEKKYDFGICPATIRIEMQKLTDDGFISQPHTSAGRVPTDEGYRFFVNNLFEKGVPEVNDIFNLEDWAEKEMGDRVRFMQQLTKNLAALSSNLALGYLFDENVLWKEGWEDVLREPEFETPELIPDFADVIKNFEKEIEEFKTNSGIKVYIGKENPFSKAKEFSIIISSCNLPNKEKGVLALMGPKRMAYEKNIGLINTLIKLLE